MQDMQAVQTTDPGSIQPRRALVRVATAVLYFAAITAIVAWALPDKGQAERRVELRSRMPDTGMVDLTDVLSTPAPKSSKLRGKARCAECGVIESMRTIDRRDEIVGGCDVGDTSGMRTPGALFDVGERMELVTLAGILAGVIAGDQGGKRVRVTTRYQIVVRFRDGSRHVFNEDTPGTLRVGERILVIGATTGAHG